MDKLQLLSTIANDFNKEGITWNLGASCMLYLREIVSEFNDIDIMVALEDIDKVQQLMSKYATPIKREPNEQYKTRYFLEYDIDGVEIDIMSGFVIVTKDNEYSFTLNKDDEYDIYKLKGVDIKLASVEEWYKYYSLMGRTNKVKLLKNYVKMSDL